MLFKSLALAAAGLAGVTQAFLLPPEVSESDIEAIKTLPLKTYIVPQSQDLNITCPGCHQRLKSKHGMPKVKVDKPSHLELHFAIKHEAGDDEIGHDRLLVNGFELYPHPDPRNYVINAVLARDSVDPRRKHHKHKSGPLSLPLGFGLQTNSMKKAVGDELQLVALDLQIIEVGTKFVDGIPNVHINLVKDFNGFLAIGSIDTTESQTLQSRPTQKQDDCTTLLCEWIAAIKDKVAHMKAGRPCAAKMGQRPPHHHHHPGGHHREMAHYDHHRSWRHLFRSITAHILLPIAVGIIAGVSVSLIGMMVGTLVVSVWRMFFRRHTHGHRRGRRGSMRRANAMAVDGSAKSGGLALADYQDQLRLLESQNKKRLLMARTVQDDEKAAGAANKVTIHEAVTDDEKSGLLDDQELPPAYDEEEARDVDV